MARRIVALLATTALVLLGCGNDDADPSEAPPLTNELGFETFEPDDNPWGRPETIEPSQ